jgi:branched-chain amino acid transport system substrate-binding protein
MKRRKTVFIHTVRWRSVRRNTTALPIIALIVLLLMGLNACAPNGLGNSITPTQSQGTVTIGVSLSLTGGFSDDGKATQQGYKLWQKAINESGGLLGHQVRLDVLDDNSNIAQTQSNYERLIAVDHVDFVLGPFDDAPTVAGAEVAARHGYAFINPTGTAPSDFQHGLANLFTVSLSAAKYLGSFERYVLSLPASMRPKTVAYASANDPFTQSQIESVKPLLEQGGLSTAFYSIYDAANTDYTLVAQKIVASHADAVILGTDGVPDCAPFIKTFVQQRYNPKLLIATAGPDQGASFVSAIGKQNTEGLLVPNGGWWPTIDTYQNAQFTKDYVAKYGGSPNDISSDTVQAYSVGQVLSQAVAKVQSLDNAKVMDALRQGTFQSLQGPVQFASDGQNSAMTAVLFQWQAGQLIPVSPKSSAQASMEYPKPVWPE